MNPRKPSKEGTMNKIKVGDYIREKRTALNLTQEELAERLNVTNKTVSRWECGIFLPPVEKLYELSKLFDVTVDELLNGTEQRLATEQPNEEPVKEESWKSPIQKYREEQSNRLIRQFLIFSSVFILFFSAMFYTKCLVSFFLFLALRSTFLATKLLGEKRRAIADTILSFVSLLSLGILQTVYISRYRGNESVKVWLILGLVLLLLCLIVLLVLDVKKMCKYVTLPKYKMPKCVPYVVLAVCILVTFCSATVLNVAGISRYRVGSFAKNTVEYFVEDVKLGANGWVSNREEVRHDSFGVTETDAESLSEFLQTLAVKEEGNAFPFIYKENTGYVNIVIFTNSFIFRMNDTYTKIALEKREYRNDGYFLRDGAYYFHSVRYYSCAQDVGIALKDYLLRCALEETV